MSSLAAAADALLEARKLDKSFSEIRVLSGVSLSLRAGEVHAVVGENGAGKSTLMKLLAGLEQPDAGEIRFEGRPVRMRSPHDALVCGIAMIHQELLPFLDLTVAENIFMGHGLGSGLLGWIDEGALHRKAGELLQRLAIPVRPSERMGDLRVAEMQGVEIAKALAHDAKVLIMDEPTSALSERESEALFRIITDLKRRGVAIVYISHKLTEVFRLADRITVLRDGLSVGTFNVSELTTDRLISLMVGRELRVSRVERAPAGFGIPLLSVKGLGRTGRFQSVSFEVRRGEIVGLGGLMGAGRTDVLNAIYGLEPADSGQISVCGRPVRIRQPKDALHAGIGFVTEDRKTYGLIPTFGPRPNVTLAALRRWCRHGFIRRTAETSEADGQLARLGIRSRHGPNQSVRFLSGGNQQKVVLARSLLAIPEILLVDEPTKGIDIAAKAEVHAIIRELAAAGKAVLLVSSELPELMGLSDRILVMRAGTMTGEVNPRQSTPEEILKLAIPE